MNEQDDQPEEKTSDERKALLAVNIQEKVMAGWRVESQSDFQAVLVLRRPVNRVGHLVVTIITMGLWLIPWILIELARGDTRMLLVVDRLGEFKEQKAVSVN